MKHLGYFLQAIFIYLFMIIIKTLGVNSSRVLFSKIFNLLGKFFRSEKIIKKNLSYILPNLKENEKKVLIEKMWSNYSKTFVEYFFLKEFKKNLNHITISGLEILDKIKEDNKPVIFVSGHFSNFELMSMELVKNNVNLAILYRPLNNYMINPLMTNIRKKYVCKNQFVKGMKGLKQAIDYLDKKFCIALMIDQRLSEGEKIKFFSHDAYTTTLPAQLAIKYNCNIVPIYLKRKDNNEFNMEIRQPILINQFENDSNKKSNITKKLNKIIEEMILKDPSQWILTHNRWK